MSDTVISVEGLGKKYRLGANVGPQKTLRESIVDVSKAPLRTANRLAGRTPASGARGERPEFWALKDVSFEVKEGEVLGVIGRNGAGKSTLLKLLSQITEPTEGRIRMKGRVSSLLEVGTGFHPELTGRENIMLNGAILGMSRVDIVRRFDEIVAFAEVEQFIDTQVKFYSSGMYLRLAFAVAAHLEPEVLIIDEVLAVGDATFQKKCLGKMGEVSKEGRTVLFVSHNLSAVTSLCQTALFLQNGYFVQLGPSDKVVSQYLASGADLAGRVSLLDRSDNHSDIIQFEDVSIYQNGIESQGSVTTDADVEVRVRYQLFRDISGIQVALNLYTEREEELLGSSDVDIDLDLERKRVSGMYETRCVVPAVFLRSGRYSILLHCGRPNMENIQTLRGAISFEVTDPNGIAAKLGQNRTSLLVPRLPWSTTLEISN